jgi:radical SAM protein with 4Fe4S-binding SPASM domain
MSPRVLPLVPAAAVPEVFGAHGTPTLGSAPFFEQERLRECDFHIRNIGWTLGNDCPYRCTHCYSMSARAKGANLAEWMVERVVDQLAINGIETVNLGGNEPLYTNGLDPRQSLLPLIVRRLSDRGILVGLTTAGITLLYLEEHHPDTVALLNDIDISFDSPFEHEHNANRGAKLFDMAVRSLDIAQRRGIPHTVIMCGMSWNFSPGHIHSLVDLATRYGAHVRINPIKPVEAAHMSAELSPQDYYAGFRLLMELCDSVDLGEPPLAALAENAEAKGCPCGRSSFRIHSITPERTIPVSPCVYLHDYKAGDLLVDDLHDIVRSPQFRVFRRRNGNPHAVRGCDGCHLLDSCRGGCAARAYLTHLHRTSLQTLFARDPYCPKDECAGPSLPAQMPSAPSTRLVHQDYLCTWIGKPKG